MNIQTEVAVIGLIQAIMVAIIGGLFAGGMRKSNKRLMKEDLRSAIRAEENRIMMEMLSATGKLSRETAKAIKRSSINGGQINGEMDKALNESDKSDDEYQKFVQQLISKEILR